MIWISIWVNVSLCHIIVVLKNWNGGETIVLWILKICLQVISYYDSYKTFRHICIKWKEIISCITIYFTSRTSERAIVSDLLSVFNHSQLKVQLIFLEQSADNLLVSVVEQYPVLAPPQLMANRIYCGSRSTFFRSETNRAILRFSSLGR